MEHLYASLMYTGFRGKVNLVIFIDRITKCRNDASGYYI